MKKRLLLFMLLGISVFCISGCGKSVEEIIEEDIVDTETEISLGEWNENTYKNDFLRLTYQKPEDWTRYSDEDIKAVMKAGLENVDGSELSKKLAELTSVTYMMTSKPNGTNIILMSENPVLSINIDNYAKTLKEQLESQTSVSYTVTDAVVTEVNGKSLHTMIAEVSGIKQHYYLYQQGEHFVSIIVSLAPGDTADNIINQFTFE